MSNSVTAAHRGRRRFLPLIWAASAVSAVILVLGVNGTLSAWTAAIITNQTNNVATANALILKEVGPDGTAAHTSQTCYSSQGAGNNYSCTNINKYGGAGVGITPMSPGDTRIIPVTFTNVGGAAGASFKLAAGACTQTPTAAPAATPPINNLCTATGELTVAVSCSNGATYVAASAWTDLVYAAGPAGGIGTLTHTAALAAGASWTCQFTVALDANASVTDQGITLSQPLTWTLA